MAKRGRPRHPDILTPREWEVLELLREGLSNEQIAERLGITVRTARYHVSEILGKLGVGGRQQAAAWEPDRRPWWMTAAAPLLFWRKLGVGWLSSALAGGLAVAVTAGIGILAWGLLRTGGDDGPTNAPATTPEVTLSAASPLEPLLSPEDAMERLLQEPNVGDVLRAVTERDVERLLELLDWRPQPCGTKATSRCPQGVATGIELPMAYVGFADTFAVTAETLRPALTDLLAGEPLSLTFASRSREGPLVWREGTIGAGAGLYVGLEGPQRPVRPSVLWGDAAQMRGMFLVVDGGSESPIVELGSLSETWTAADNALELGFAGHEVIAFETERPVAMLVCDVQEAAQGRAEIQMDDSRILTGLFCDDSDPMDGEVLPSATKWEFALTIVAPGGQRPAYLTPESPWTCRQERRVLPIFMRCELGEDAISLSIIGPSH